MIFAASFAAGAGWAALDTMSKTQSRALQELADTVKLMDVRLGATENAVAVSSALIGKLSPRKSASGEED